MRVLGIDPGLANTGWGVIGTGGAKIRHIAHGNISTSAGQAGGKRLLSIRKSLIDIITEYEPEIAGIESIFFAKNQTSAIPVARAMGVVLVTCEELGLEVEEFSPSRIKQAITGVGTADKNQMQELLRIILGIREIPKPDHAADALAAAICRYHSLTVPKGAARDV
jgi:crossover junction endodeoxyribonuclease RuvC